MTSIDEQLQQNLQEFQQNLQNIEQMTEEVAGLGLAVPVNDEVKRELKRKLYDRHQQRYEELADAKRQEVSQGVAKARQDLFRPYKTITDSYAEVNMSMRDALQRLEGVREPAELSQRLQTAVELGDKVLAQAVLRAVVDRVGDIGQAGSELARQYLSYYPNEAQAYQNLVDASAEQQRVMEMGVGWSPLNPEAPVFAYGRGAGPTEGTPLTEHPTTHNSGPGGSVIPDHIVSSVQPEAGDGGE